MKEVALELYIGHQLTMNSLIPVIQLHVLVLYHCQISLINVNETRAASYVGVKKKSSLRAVNAIHKYTSRDRQMYWSKRQILSGGHYLTGNDNYGVVR